MPDLWIARRAPRRGLFLRGVGNNQNLMFVMKPNQERGELDELVRAQLDKQGITQDSAVEAVIEKAEKDYENRVKTQETIKELRRLMAIRAAGGKLMQYGFRKWRQAFFPATKRFKKDA